MRVTCGSERDSAAYNRAALSIIDSGVPRAASGSVHMHAPVYCYFLALAYKIGGIRLFSIAVPQAILAGLACFLVGLAAGRASPSPLTAASLAGAVLYLVNLRAAMYVGYVYPTMLVVALTALALAVANYPMRRMTVAVLAGTIAVATFAQASFFAIACGVAVWLLLQSWRGRNRLPLVGGIAILAVVTVKIFASTAGGTRNDLQQLSRGVRWETNNPRFENMRLTDLWEDRLGPNPWTSWHMSEQEQQRFDSYLTRASGDGQRAFRLWFRDNPGRYLKLCLIRLRTAFGPYTGQMSPRNRAISTAIWLLLWPAGIYGMWILRRHPAAQLVMCSYAGYAVLAAFVTEDFYLRYRVPIETLLAAVAATGYCRWMQQLRRSAPGLTGESRHKKPSAEREGAGNEARPDECSTAGDDHCRADARGVSDRRRNGIEVGRDGVSGLPGSST